MSVPLPVVTGRPRRFFVIALIDFAMTPIPYKYQLPRISFWAV